MLSMNCSYSCSYNYRDSHQLGAIDADCRQDASPSLPSSGTASLECIHGLTAPNEKAVFTDRLCNLGCRLQIGLEPTYAANMHNA